jgi:serine protease Do
MRRVLPLLVLTLLSTPTRGQEASFREAQLIDQAMAETARKAEPAIASIFVSRSEDYRRLLNDSPPEDQPGSLGGFDRDKTRKTLSESIKDTPRLSRELTKLDLSDPEHVPESYGSGVVISAQGLVLTNFHVVRDATKIYVRLPGGKGSYANIHAGDARCDLAVLRLLNRPEGPLPFLRHGKTQVRKAQLILTLTNPFAPGFRDAKPRASWGMVSDLRQKNPKRPASEQDAKTSLYNYATLIQIDRNLPLGCSGGALFNLGGQWVGLITSLAGVSGEGGGAYAIPLDARIAGIVHALEKGEEVEYGFLGIMFQRQDFRAPNRLRSGGVSFLDVIPGSPAMKAGLARTDLILEVDGTPVNENEDLMLAISCAQAGATVHLKILRSGQIETLPVTVAKYYNAEPFIASVKHPFVRGIRAESTSVIAQRGFQQDIPPGVLVREVKKGSPAEAARLQDANILKVDGEEIQTPAEFYQKMRKAGPVELTLSGTDDQGNPLKVTLD